MLKRIFYIFLLFISVKSVGQRANSSPYSFFGMGQQNSYQTVEQASMGGIGISFDNSYHLNFINPATNASLHLSTYTIGMIVNDLTIKDTSNSQSSTSTNLSYVGIGFPIGSKAGVSFGLQPNSSVGYSLLKENKDSDGKVKEITRFYGDGGTNRIYGAFGMFLTKEISVGVNAEFVFGKIENNVFSRRANVRLATKNDDVLNIRGGTLKIGLQYKKELLNKLAINFGAVLKLENNLNVDGSEILYSSFLGVARDTLHNLTIDGKIISPIKTGLGFGLGKADKWFAGLEYEFQEALNTKDYRSTTSNGYAYGSSNKLSLGGFYLPKINSISSYWNRVTYRGGVRFEKTGLLIDRSGRFTEINDFGISFGLGLPLGKKISNLNLGLEYGKKGTTANNLIQENYFNFRLSLSLSDRWFIKRRID